MTELVEHQTGEGGKMEACEHGRQTLIVAGEAAKAAGPSEAALEDPASRPIGRFVSIMRSVLSRVLT